MAFEYLQGKRCHCLSRQPVPVAYSPFIPLYCILFFCNISPYMYVWTVSGIESMSYEERLSTPGLTDLKAERQSHCFLQLPEVEKHRGKCWTLLLEMMSRPAGMSQSCTMGGSDWTLGKFSALWGWSNTAKKLPREVVDVSWL